MSFCKSFRTRLFTLCALAALSGAVLFFTPALDLGTTALFYNNGEFAWRSAAVPNFFHDLVHPVSLGLAALFAGVAVYQAAKKRPVRPVVFLLLTLIIGPGLITNTLLKDNWGRARPLQVSEFGGTQNFSPPLLMANQCDRNCSFVGGDAAFGYWFHSFAYIAPRRRRAVFLAGMGVGVGYSVLRVGMGAHFLSDVFFAAIVVLIASAAVQACLFGKAALKEKWREFLGGQ